MKFLKFLVFGALIAAGVFVAGTIYTVNAAGEYARTHDMTVEVNPSDILDLSPADTWQQVCAMEHTPSLDRLCARDLSGVPTIREAIQNAPQFIEDYIK